MLKCYEKANRATIRHFNAKDIGRITRYALLDGESERNIIIRVALEVGRLREILLKINEIVKSTLPLVHTAIKDIDLIVSAIENIKNFVVSGMSLAIIFPEAYAFLIRLILTAEKITTDIANSLRTVENTLIRFDLSDIIGDLTTGVTQNGQ
jgi:hypothetical protein